MAGHYKIEQLTWVTSHKFNNKESLAQVIINNLGNIGR